MRLTLPSFALCLFLRAVLVQSFTNATIHPRSLDTQLYIEQLKKLNLPDSMTRLSLQVKQKYRCSKCEIALMQLPRVDYIHASFYCTKPKGLFSAFMDPDRYVIVNYIPTQDKIIGEQDNYLETGLTWAAISIETLRADIPVWRILQLAMWAGVDALTGIVFIRRELQPLAAVTYELYREAPLSAFFGNGYLLGQDE